MPEVIPEPILSRVSLINRLGVPSGTRPGGTAIRSRTWVQPSAPRPVQCGGRLQISNKNFAVLRTTYWHGAPTGYELGDRHAAGPITG